MDIERIIASGFDRVKSYCDRGFEAIAQRLSAIEGRVVLQGEKGDQGEPGERGLDGGPGERGFDGKDGAPGRDGQPGVPGRDGKDGADGLDGKDGAAGLDGLGFDDLSLDYDGERTITFRLQRGEQVKHYPIKLPILLDRGVWRSREAPYEKGDGVSWGGSLWIAQADTRSKPDTGGSEWRLAVKRGRDGDDGKDGAPGERGPQGEPGRNGSSF